MLVDMRYISEVHIFNTLETIRTDRVSFLIKHRLTPFTNIFYIMKQTMSIKNPREIKADSGKEVLKYHYLPTSRVYEKNKHIANFGDMLVFCFYGEIVEY